MYLRLDHLNYNITESIVTMEFVNNKIELYIEIGSEVIDDTDDYDMRKIRLYHHNGFSTGAANPKELEGKNFVWECEENGNGEDAGYLYVGYHDNVTEGTIEVLAVTETEITMRWHGVGCGLPFEAEFTAKLPQERIYTINAWESLEMPIGENGTLYLLNVPEYETCREAVCESRQWEEFNAALDFKVVYQGEEYFGKVVYTNGKIHYETYFDERCPLCVKSTGCGWDPYFGHIDFRFQVSQKQGHIEEWGN